MFHGLSEGKMWQPPTIGPSAAGAGVADGAAEAAGVAVAPPGPGGSVPVPVPPPPPHALRTMSMASAKPRIVRKLAPAQRFFMLRACTPCGSARCV